MPFDCIANICGGGGRRAPRDDGQRSTTVVTSQNVNIESSVVANKSFEIEVRTVSRSTWVVDQVSPSTTGKALKDWLLELDVRFRMYRVELIFGTKVISDSDTLHKCGIGPHAQILAVFTDLRAFALVVGGGVAGRTATQELSTLFPTHDIVLVDTQEFSEHAQGIARAYADPATWEGLVVRHADAVSAYSNVRFLQGEVLKLRPGVANVAFPCGMEEPREFVVRFDFCVIATGCAFSPTGPAGESLWHPTSTSAAREGTEWPSLDERTVAGRQRHVLEEHLRLWNLSDKGGRVLVYGADYYGVEWACDLRHYFPGLTVTLADDLPRCLTTLPTEAAEYAEVYLRDHGIRTIYGVKYEPGSSKFWSSLGWDRKADFIYVLKGVAPRNSFMPSSSVSSRGPGGGGWILTNNKLQVCTGKTGDRPSHVWGDGRIFAVGDCHYGAVTESSKRSTRTDDCGSSAGQPTSLDGFAIPPVPKTAFAAIVWAKMACKNISLIASGRAPEVASWPEEAGMLAVGLGPSDGIVTWKVNWTRDSGEVLMTGHAAAEMKRRTVFSSDREMLARPGGWLAAFKDGLDPCERSPVMSMGG